MSQAIWPRVRYFCLSPPSPPRPHLVYVDEVGNSQGGLERQVLKMAELPISLGPWMQRGSKAAPYQGHLTWVFIGGRNEELGLNHYTFRVYALPQSHHHQSHSYVQWTSHQIKIPHPLHLYISKLLCAFFSWAAVYKSPPLIPIPGGLWAFPSPWPFPIHPHLSSGSSLLTSQNWLKWHPSHDFFLTLPYFFGSLFSLSDLKYFRMERCASAPRLLPPHPFL